MYKISSVKKLKRYEICHILPSLLTTYFELVQYQATKKSLNVNGESWKEREKIMGNIQERKSACITGEYISGNDSVSLCKLSPLFLSLYKNHLGS